jgi:hypothetical protein
MMRISKIPLPQEAKEQLLAREALLTGPFAILGVVLFVVAHWIEMDKYVLLWWIAALLAALALFLVSGPGRRTIVIVLAGITVAFLAV